MEISPAFVADAESFELVEPGEGALDDPAGAPESRAVCDATAGDERLDAELPQQAAVLVEVVAPVGEQPYGPVAGVHAVP